MKKHVISVGFALLTTTVFASPTTTNQIEGCELNGTVYPEGAVISMFGGAVSGSLPLDIVCSQAISSFEKVKATNEVNKYKYNYQISYQWVKISRKLVMGINQG